MEKNNVSSMFIYKDLWRRYVKGIWALKVALIPIMFFMVVAAMSENLINRYSGEVTHCVESGKITGKIGDVLYLWKLLLSSAVYIVSSELYPYILVKPLQMVYLSSLRDSLEGYIGLDFISFNEMGVGKVLATIERRGMSTGELISVIITQLLPIPLFFMFFIFGILTDLNLRVLLVIMFFIALYIYMTIIITDYRTRWRDVANDKINNLYNLYNEILYNYETVKAFNNESYELKRYDRRAQQILRPATKLWRGLYMLNLVQKLILFSMDAVVLSLLFIQNEINVKSVSQYFLYSGTLKRKFGGFGTFYGTLKLTLTNIKSSYIIPQDADNGIKAMKSFERGIVFDNVSVYQGGFLIFKGVNFNVRKNEKIAIVGTNGSGKSTFIKVLLGFCDYDGSIKLDSEELRDIQRRDIRDLISFVPQDSSLLDETVQENIMYGCGKSEEEMVAVTTKLGVHSSIMRLKDSYSAIVGERGKNLSGGERQKVALSRAVLRDRDIYIMDEPTANIDAASETQIFKTLFTDEFNKTVFVIVHNHDLLVYVDKILAFDRGTATLYNSYAEFLKSHKNQIDFYSQSIVPIDKTAHMPLDK